MTHGDFIWCDLSAYDDDKARRFYARLFGWRYDRITGADGAPYHIASTRRGVCAAIFNMPEKFQNIGLPSFWMPYISVVDINAAVEVATRNGGKVEMGPQAFDENGTIALIRDPLGAGFTVYEGDGLTLRAKNAPPGHMAWNALYVSDADAITQFYEALFGWRVKSAPGEAGRFDIRHSDGRIISSIEELSDDIRGRYEFWGVHFAVKNMQTALRALVKHGGTVVGDYEDERGALILAKDPGGAAFFLSGAG